MDRSPSTADHVPAHVRKSEGIESSFSFFPLKWSKSSLVLIVIHLYVLLLDELQSAFKTNIAYWLVYLHFQLSEVVCHALSWKCYYHSICILEYGFGLPEVQFVLEDLGKNIRFTGKIFRWFNWVLDTRAEENYASMLVVGICLKIVIGFCGSGKANIVAEFGHYISIDVL